MPYKVSGSLSQPMDLTVLDLDGNLQARQNLSAGPYEITGLTAPSGIIFGTTSDDSFRGFGKVPFINYQDSYTKLLLHFNESPLTDVMGKVLTLNGSVARSAAQSKFGGYAGYFDGVDDYITIPTSQDFAFGTGDFTIDCWLYLTVPINQSSNDVRQVWQAGRIWTNGYSACDIQFGHHSTWGSGTKLIFRWTTNEVQNIASITSVTLNDGVWYHLAIVRNSGIVTYYINGQALSGGASFTHSITLTGGSPAYIGVQDWNGGFYWYFKGYIDELRISKGIARWTSNFTPPVYAY